MADDIDARVIEGLAGQLYAKDRLEAGAAFVWWHLASDAVKHLWRQRACKQISDFNVRNRAPWDEPPASTLTRSGFR